MYSIRENKSAPQKVIGCVVSLVYWAAERINIVDPIAATYQHELVISKWDLRTMHARMCDIEVINNVLVQVDESKETMLENVEPISLELALVESSSEKKGGAENETELIRLRKENEQQVETILKLKKKNKILEEKIILLEVHEVTQKATAGKDKEMEEMQKKIENITREHNLKVEDFRLILAARDELIVQQQETIDSLRNQLNEVVNSERSKVQERYSSRKMCEDDEEQEHMNNEVEASRVEEMPKKQVVDPSSLVKRVKQKERKRKELHDYTYGKSRHQGRKMAAINLSSKKGVSVDDQPSIPVVIDVLDEGDEKEQKRVKSDTTLALRTKISRMLNTYVRDRLKQIHNEEGMDATVWNSGISGVMVSLEDVNNILKNSAISNFVIDSYSFILAEKQRDIESRGRKLKNKSYFFPSFSVSMFNVEDLDQHDSVINKHLESSTRGYNLLFFPLNHVTFHWTLLLFDKMNGEWYHYNSMLPRKEDASDRCFDSIGIVKIYVEEFYKRQWNEGDDNTQDFIAVYNDRKCPQQSDTSLDCGLYVCIFMRLLSEHGHTEERGNDYIATRSEEPSPTTKTILPTSVSTDDIRKFAVELIEAFVEDQLRSWPTQRRKHPQIADDDFQ